MYLPFVDVLSSVPNPEDAQQVGSNAATRSHNLAVKSFSDGDALWNYDFVDMECNIIDWPVTIVFCGSNATIESINKHYWGKASANICWFEFKTQNGQERVCDTGTKSAGRTMCHMRLYASDGICNHNSEFGQYVIATTHYDRNEGWWWLGRHQVGWSEDAALEIAAKIPSGWWIESAQLPELNWGNYESGYWIDNRYYQCDGYITLIHTDKSLAFR